MTDLKMHGLCTWPSGMHDFSDGRCTRCGHMEPMSEPVAEVVAVTEGDETAQPVTAPPTGVAVDNVRLLSAVTAFAKWWKHLVPSLPDDYDCRMTCEEADTAAGLFRALGDDDTAASILSAHSIYDMPGDSHYQGKRS